VIAADFVPIRTYQTTWILLGTGQRYDVIIDAKATAGNYWFRAEAARDCFSTNQYVGRAIFTYGETPVADPISQPLSPAPAVCKDESPLVPWWSTIVPNNDFHEQVRRLDVDLHQEQVAGNGQNVIFWGINLTAIDINWEKPTLQYVIDKNTTYPQVYNLVELPVEHIWTYWIIQETEGTLVPIPHPMHLHG
jgi:FtsP/CotA-like multicopper oxidase with cupredoxin domain